MAQHRAPLLQGKAFDPAADFSIAIDYDLNLPLTAFGGLAIGFGIGEDIDGMNSAGAVITSNGPLTIAAGGAARVNDVTQVPAFLGLMPPKTGSFFVSYEAATGDVTVGIGAAGAASPSSDATFAGLQNSWNDTPLLTSFFLRSDNSVGLPWTSGSADAVFGNFRVLSGTPTAINIPEPSSLAILALASLSLCINPRHRKVT